MKNPEGVDLSYLSDDSEAPPPKPKSRGIVAKGALKDYYSEKVRYRGGNSVGAVSSSLHRMKFSPIPKPQRVTMRTVSVQCLSLKGRSTVLAGGELILTFDKNGIAPMPVSKMALLAQVQRARPGRFVVVEPEEVQPLFISVLPPQAEAEVEVLDIPEDVEELETIKPVFVQTPNKKSTGKKSKKSKKD